MNEGELRTGDTVRVELDPGEFKFAQEGHGGWEDFMAEVCCILMDRPVSLNITAAFEMFKESVRNTPLTQTQYCTANRGVCM